MAPWGDMPKPTHPGIGDDKILLIKKEKKGFIERKIMCCMVCRFNGVRDREN